MNGNNNQYSYQNPDLTRPPNSINQDSKTPFNQFHNNNQLYYNQIAQPSNYLQQPQKNNEEMQFSENNAPSENEKPTSSFCSILFSIKTSLILLFTSIILLIIIIKFEHKINDFFKIKTSHVIEISIIIVLCFMVLSSLILTIRFIRFLYRKYLKYD
ncbi:hypothetical protein A0H76_871 [Hepatospora eriocheir]|uniref:Transmembrane protein n=1 Tax=Hepatospora eriocheir TaxID=1081669 RepID=A0A1X0QLK7_9MICR|nr:hypothetical protein A0H76_871 [Hepatospora eriocheir]